MKTTITTILSLTTLVSAFAQDPAPPATAAKKQDPEAVKLLERFDSLLYVPRAAGLKDLEFTTRLPGGVDWVIRWKAPDLVASELRVPADAPAKNAQALKLYIPTVQDEAAKKAPGAVKIFVGEVLHEQHKDDDVLLVAPNEVKIVARSEASKALIKEQVLSFDEAGLVKQARVTAPTGAVMTLEPTYTAWNGKQVYETLKTTFGPDSSQSVAFEYAVVDGFLLAKKLTTKGTGRAKASEGTLEFRDVKVNAGLDDKLFEKPPAPKPNGG